MKEYIDSLEKSFLRYRLYRLRQLALHGTPYDLEPEIQEYFESLDEFTEWRGFASTWDVKQTEEGWVIVRRVYTEHEEWNAKVRSLTTVLPTKRRKANVTTDE